MDKIETTWTPFATADDIAHAFNSAGPRKYWKATVGGTRGLPVVYFKSRSTMVELTMYPDTGQMVVGFNKAACAFGDFMASTYKALETVLSALKASGYPVTAPLDDADGALRLQYDPRLKTVTVHLAGLADDWCEYAPPAGFKSSTEKI